MDVKVNLTDNTAEREARANECQAEFARSQAICARLSQVILMSELLNIFFSVFRFFVFYLLFFGLGRGWGTTVPAHNLTSFFLMFLSIF